MTTEAEKLASEYRKELDEISNRNYELRMKVQEQAAEIERLKFAYMDGYEGGKQGICDAAQAEIDRLREILARALAQMRTQRRIDRAEFPSEVEDEIRIELGERV